jgi:GTPase SAR1 family protein
MESEQPAKPRLIKYKVFGPKNSGRKSLVFRYSQNAFKRDEVPTFDIDFMVKILNKNGKKYQIKIFRPKSDEEMGSKEYLKGIKMVIYIFDITNEDSINHFKQNIEKLFENADKNAFKYVLGNKLDLEEQRKIKEDEAKVLCEKYKYIYREISCKSGKNINEVFDEAFEQYIKRFPGKKEESKKPENKIDEDLKDVNPLEGGEKVEEIKAQLKNIK